jgi:hypothetical protein
VIGHAGPSRSVGDTLPLFGDVLRAAAPAPYRTRGPETSRLAAEALSTARLTTLQADALAFVVAAGERGATFDEWASARGHPSSQSGRFTALAERGLIIASGARRPTRAGIPARVFTATAAGTEVARG